MRKELFTAAAGVAATLVTRHLIRTESVERQVKRVEKTSREVAHRSQLAVHVLKGLPLIYGARKRMGTLLIDEQSGNNWRISDVILDGSDTVRTVSQMLTDRINSPEFQADFQSRFDAIGVSMTGDDIIFERSHLSNLKIGVQVENVKGVILRHLFLKGSHRSSDSENNTPQWDGDTFGE